LPQSLYLKSKEEYEKRDIKQNREFHRYRADRGTQYLLHAKLRDDPLIAKQ
jgi:hypothetical protein